MRTKILSIVLGGMSLMALVSAGGKEMARLVRTREFDLGKIQSIRLDFDGDDIRILRSDSGTLVLKEYMNADKEAYYARATVRDGELSFTEGERPRWSAFESYIELCIPPDYDGSLSLHSTSGAVESRTPLRLSGAFSADTTSGPLTLRDIEASAINLATTSGRVNGRGLAAPALKVVGTSGTLALEGLEADTIHVETTSADTAMRDANGTIAYRTKSGKLTMSEINGSGSFSASGEGMIEASFATVTGDIAVSTKNGDIAVTLPKRLDFKFFASAKEGSIEASFADQLSIAEHTAAGVVGPSPRSSIELVTRNGDIRASR